MKEVVLSIDVEDWYHLDYFNRKECEIDYSLLDGLDTYIKIIQKYNISSSFFVLGEIAARNINFYKDLVSCNYDISSHGWDHKRPLSMSITDFKKDIEKSYQVMQEINGKNEFGYRAPCFSLDEERHKLLKNYFQYSSSKINFTDHPLYGSLNLKEFNQIENNIYIKNDFVEFEVSTYKFLNKNVPISGGGYLRIIPSIIFDYVLKKYLETNQIYVLYIHPFELSKLDTPKLPSSTHPINKLRRSYGRKKTRYKLEKLIDLLHSYDYKFTNFINIRKRIIDNI